MSINPTLRPEVDISDAQAERYADLGVGAVGDLRERYCLAEGGNSTSAAHAVRSRSRRAGVTGVRDQELHYIGDDAEGQDGAPVDTHRHKSKVLAAVAMCQLADAFFGTSGVRQGQEEGLAAMRRVGLSLRANGTTDRIRQYLNTDDIE